MESNNEILKKVLMFRSMVADLNNAILLETVKEQSKTIKELTAYARSLEKVIERSLEDE